MNGFKIVDILAHRKQVHNNIYKFTFEPVDDFLLPTGNDPERSKKEVLNKSIGFDGH